MGDHLEFLLTAACPSIKFRVKKEMGLEMALDEERYLQSCILEDHLVQRFLSIQESDGWINNDLHSENGIETAVRVLSEKGLMANHPSLSRMLIQLEAREESFDNGSLGNVGKILDHLSLGGSQLIRATIFAYAGVEDREFVREQIKAAIDVFKYVIGVEKIGDIILIYRGKRVFRPGVKWPSIYHLRLLAHTRAWRNGENRKIMSKAIQRLVDLSPLPEINGLYKSQIVSPGSFAMHNFRTDTTNIDSKDLMMWFHRMELLARLGVISQIQELRVQVDSLTKMVCQQSGVFSHRSRKHTHYYFTRWGPYTGLALEGNWRGRKRYLCDLLFRSLLIMHFSEKG